MRAHNDRVIAVILATSPGGMLPGSWTRPPEGFPDVLGRMGGDRFGVCCCLGQPGGAEQVAEGLRRVLSQAFLVGPAPAGSTHGLALGVAAPASRGEG